MAKKKKRKSSPVKYNSKAELAAQRLMAAFQELPSAELRKQIRTMELDLQTLQTQLETAQRVLADRDQLAEDLKKMSIGKLERLVGEKQHHWRFAQHILDAKRKRGENFGANRLIPRNLDSKLLQLVMVTGGVSTGDKYHSPRAMPTALLGA